MNTALTTIQTAAYRAQGPGPDLGGITDWMQNNVMACLLTVVAVVALWFGRKGDTKTVIAIVGVIILVGFIMSGAALDFGGDLGKFIK